MEALEAMVNAGVFAGEAQAVLGLIQGLQQQVQNAGEVNQQIQHQMQNAGEANQQLQQRIAQLEQVVAAQGLAGPGAPAGAVPPGAGDEFHVKLPTPAVPQFFWGQEGKAPTVRVWQWTMDQFYRNWPNMTEQQKLLFAIPFFRGFAANWWQQYEHMAVMGTMLAIDRWDALKPVMLKQFTVLDEAEKARDALDALRQNSSVSVFNHRFTELMLQIPAEEKPDAVMKHQYIAKLKPWLQFKVRVENPPTLQMAMEAADRIDRVRAPGASSSSSRPNNRAAGAGYVRHSASSAEPMDLGALSMRSAKQKRGKDSKSPATPLSERQKQYLRDNDGCFYCRKAHAGHMARECPVKLQNQGRRGSNSRAQ